MLWYVIDTSQAVGCVTNLKQGDKRVYAEIIILRAVETTDCELSHPHFGDSH